MKRLTVWILFLAVTKLQAQSIESRPSLRAGLGYTHDFPGMNGYTALAEYGFPIFAGFEGAIGAKRADITGFPRTSQVQEYTKATSLDFNLYWLPLRTETSTFKIGLGYSFSFYNIKRAYPLIVETGGSKSTTWPAQESTGHTRGINLIGEYQYMIPSTGLLLGIRGALYKAYTCTYFIGPTLGFQL